MTHTHTHTQNHFGDTVRYFFTTMSLLTTLSTSLLHNRFTWPRGHRSRPYQAKIIWEPNETVFCTNELEN